MKHSSIESHAAGGVAVYRVGAFLDMWHFYRMIRIGAWREAARKIRYLWRVRASFLSRGHWNGFLAEADVQVPRAGHGWTRRRALASLHRAVATTHWARHDPCGTVRLACDETRYCVTCDRDDRAWSVVEASSTAEEER